MKIIVAVITAVLINGCSQKDPMESIGEEHRVFLFGDDESHIAFMGQPSEGSELDCNPSKMAQGYIFSAEDKKVVLESLRPSGSIKHMVTEINDAADSITIKAVNGANIPFDMKFTNLSENGASISQNGENASDYVRCIK